MRILVVDDSQPIRDFVMQNLAEREGFAVLEASDGVEGLEMALADPPDLILLDLEMPHLNGFEFIDNLHARRVDIPIIIITSHGSEAIAVEFFRKGVKDYLIKPFTVEEMHNAVERALTEVRLRQEKEALTQHLATANQQLRSRVQELDVLRQVGKSITSLVSRDQVLERILDALFYVINADEVALMLVDEQVPRSRTKLHRQRGAGEVDEAVHRSVEELAAEAARMGDAITSGTMLVAPLKVGDGIIGTLGLDNYTSARRFSEHDRQLLLALADYAAIAIENARLYEEVRQADQAKSEFLSLVMREMGAPTTSIVGPLTQQLEEAIDVILSSAEEMQVLVSDLRDISDIEMGRLRLEMRPVHLTKALEDALQATQGQIEARSQHLTVEMPENLALVRADLMRLTQILVNLLSNACKYTPEGGQIHVRAWPQGGTVHCAVSDTGVGISPEDQAKLFTRFFRSENPAVRKMPGTGLGLCIVKKLVELQGGEIRVESQPGRGAIFTFTVPATVEGEGSESR